MTATPQDIVNLNALLDETAPDEAEPDAHTVLPDDTSVVLPVGLLDPSDGLIDTADVRELNGYDEEILAKCPTLGHAMQVALERAVVSLGSRAVEKGDLDALTIGDRMELLIGIRRVTWGDDITVYHTCSRCGTSQEISVPCADIPRRELRDKVSGRQFTLSLSRGKAKFSFPSGAVHKKVLSNKYDSNAEASTAMIVDCAVDTEALGILVMTEDKAKKLSIKDRRIVTDYINSNIPGPILDAIPYPCVSCGEENTLSISAAALFPY